MDIWISQIILGVAFLIAGSVKIYKSKTQLAPKMAWVEDFSQIQIRIIGAIESVCAVAILVSVVIMFIKPYVHQTLFAPLVADIILFVLMCGATWTHIRRREYKVLPITIVLGLLALYFPLLLFLVAYLLPALVKNRLPVL